MANRIRTNKFQFAMTDDERKELRKKCAILKYRVMANFFLGIINNEPTHQNLFRETNRIYGNIANNTNQIAKHLNKIPADIKNEGVILEFINLLNKNTEMLNAQLDELKKI